MTTRRVKEKSVKATMTNVGDLKTKLLKLKRDCRSKQEQIDKLEIKIQQVVDEIIANGGSATICWKN